MAQVRESARGFTVLRDMWHGSGKWADSMRVVRQCEYREVGRGCPDEGYLLQRLAFLGKLRGKFANGDHMIFGHCKRS